VPSCAHFNLIFPGWTILQQLLAKGVFPHLVCCNFKGAVLGRVPYKVAVSMLTLSLLPAYAVPSPLFPELTCLDLSAGLVVFWVESLIFLKVVGSNIWKDLLRTFLS
jgi:hypothetical protein